METFSCGILPGFIFVISSEASNLQVLALRLLLWGWAWVGKFLWNIGQTFCQYHFPKLDTSVLLVEISLCGALRQLQLKEEWQNRKQSSLHNITFLVLRQEKISLLVFSPKYQQILRRQYCLNGNLQAGPPLPYGSDFVSVWSKHTAAEGAKARTASALFASILRKIPFPW